MCYGNVLFDRLLVFTMPATRLYAGKLLNASHTVKWRKADSLPCHKHCILCILTACSTLCSALYMYNIKYSELCMQTETFKFQNKTFKLAYMWIHSLSLTHFLFSSHIQSQTEICREPLFFSYLIFFFIIQYTSDSSSLSLCQSTFSSKQMANICNFKINAFKHDFEGYKGALSITRLYIKCPCAHM